MKRQFLILASVVGAGLLGAAYFSFVAGAVEGRFEMPSAALLLGGFALLLPGLWMDGLLSLLVKAARRTIADLPALMPYILVLGGGGHLLMWKLGPLVVPWSHPDPQIDLFLWALGEALVLMVWACIAFPLLAAASIYCWKQREEGLPLATIQTSWKFAKSRYRYMVGPHAKAYIAITLGMMVLIPGVVYGLWFAFVDPITATDDRSKRPLDRSRKLTRGRRGQLVRAWLPYAIWSIPVSALPPYLPRIMEAVGPLAVVAFGVVEMFLLVIMKMTMYGMYEQRIKEAEKRKAELMSVDDVFSTLSSEAGVGAEPA